MRKKKPGLIALVDCIGPERFADSCSVCKSSAYCWESNDEGKESCMTCGARRPWVAGNKMGLILGLDTRIEDLESVFKWVSNLQAPPGTTIETVTLVKPHSKPIKEYYVHPEMANQTNEDGSVNTPQGRLWLELVFTS